MATIDIALESTSQSILNKLNSSSSGGGYTSGMQIFTSNGTFTVPENVGIIYVTACGGGGGGGAGMWTGATDSIAGGGGGGGGSLCYKEPFIVTPGQSISITVGQGGAGGVNNNSADKTWTSTKMGSNGGATVIGNLITLSGGQGGGQGGTALGLMQGGSGGLGAGGGGAGGRWASYGSTVQAGGASIQIFPRTNYIAGGANGGSGSMNQVGIGGAAGGNTSGMYGGGGGASLGGYGANGGSNGAGQSCNSYGGGGGGGYYWCNGGAGASGVVYIEW